jgi:hypothetical protein
MSPTPLSVSRPIAAAAAAKIGAKPPEMAPGIAPSSITIPSVRVGWLRMSMMPVIVGPTPWWSTGSRSPMPIPLISSSQL